MTSDREEIVVCSTCGKKYRVKMKPVRILGAGSGADWQEESLPCKHENVRYDDNREKIDEITVIP